MKLFYSIPTDSPDKSKDFNHYAEAFTLFKKAGHIFKPVSVTLVTLGICLSLALIQFTPTGAKLALGWLTLGIVLPIGFFVYFLIGMNEKMTGSFTRYIFLIFDKESEKKWLNVPDVLLHLVQIIIVFALTYSFFNIAHNSGIAIGESLKQSQDNGIAIVANKDSIYLSKKEEINKKFDTLLVSRQATVNEQIASANKTLSLIPYKRKNERLEQQKVIDGLTRQKLKIAESVDSLKAIDLSELAALHASTAGILKDANAEKVKKFSALAEKAQSTIIKFLGFDIFIVVLGAAGLQIIKQQNGIQPDFEVEHGDFGDETLLSEIIKKPFQILRTRIVNISRRLKIPEQDAPTVAGAFFARHHVRREVKQEKTKKNELRTRAKMVFQNP